MYASIIIHAQGFDLNFDLHLVHVDDVVAPTITLRDSKHHASLLSNFLLKNSLHFGGNDISHFEVQPVNILDKMAIVNLIGGLGEFTPFYILHTCVSGTCLLGGLIILHKRSQSDGITKCKKPLKYYI